MRTLSRRGRSAGSNSVAHPALPRHAPASDERIAADLGPQESAPATSRTGSTLAGVLVSNRIQVNTRAAHEAALRARRQHRQATILRAPTVVRSGPAFALVVPMMFTVETHAPDAGPHVQPKAGESIESATGIVLVLAVIFFIAGRVVIRLVDAAGNLLAVPGD
jgi:hypothetical protein